MQNLRRTIYKRSSGTWPWSCRARCAPFCAATRASGSTRAAARITSTHDFLLSFLEQNPCRDGDAFMEALFATNPDVVCSLLSATTTKPPPALPLSSSSVGKTFSNEEEEEPYFNFSDIVKRNNLTRIFGANYPPSSHAWCTAKDQKSDGIQ